MRLLQRRAPPQLRAALRCLGPGDVVLDCGAHVGHYTTRFAATGAQVYAFEPNPHAFAQLAERLAGMGNVRCIQAAVSDHAGMERLFLHRDAADDQVAWAVGSSLHAAKPNVDERTWVEVETIDLDTFIAGLGRVTVLKLDVEGEEVAILERLLASGRLGEIDHVLVEMHDRKIPELGGPGAALRGKLHGLSNVRLDWA